MAVPATLAAEAALVVSSPFLVVHRWDPEFLCVATVLTGTVHLCGLAENRSFVRNAAAGPAERDQGLAGP
ncbi:MAG: hypothetical protein OXK17_09680 [Thaumarchaeota archaeon]|nr:hypothetical protein [Nitrososphaerota archaeon]